MTENEFTKLQVKIPTQLHTDLKMLALTTRGTMADLTTKALEDLLKKSKGVIS